MPVTFYFSQESGLELSGMMRAEENMMAAMKAYPTLKQGEIIH